MITTEFYILSSIFINIMKNWIHLISIKGGLITKLMMNLKIDINLLRCG